MYSINAKYLIKYNSWKSNLNSNINSSILRMYLPLPCKGTFQQQLFLLFLVKNRYFLFKKQMKIYFYLKKQYMSIFIGCCNKILWCNSCCFTSFQPLMEDWRALKKLHLITHPIPISLEFHVSLVSFPGRNSLSTDMASHQNW